MVGGSSRRVHGDARARSKGLFVLTGVTKPERAMPLPKEEPLGSPKGDRVYISTARWTREPRIVFVPLPTP
jgi:hypothetical protein